MKIADEISKSIQEYPSLYKDVDYEKSKLKVLNHIFFTIGNGLELAQTENSAEGGYVVEPKFGYDKNTDESFRIKDKPYGKDKYKSIPKDYFDSVIYYVYSHERPIETIYKKGKYGDDKVYFRYDKRVIDDKFKTPKLYKAECLHSFTPYPFSKGYSIASEVFYNDAFLQDDWMQELIFLCKKTLEYFNDENQYKNHSYYPNEKEINRDLNNFKETFNKDGLNGVSKLRKILGYDQKETIPDYEEIYIRTTNSWKKFHKTQLEFLNSFLDKYSI